MGGDFFTVAVNEQHMAVEAGRFFLPAVFDGVAGNRESWTFQFAAFAEEISCVVVGAGVDGFTAEDILAFNQAGIALRSDAAEVARELRFIGHNQAVAEADAHIAVADVTAGLFIIVDGTGGNRRLYVL